MGPLITGEHRDKVDGYVAGAAEEGATVVVDGRDGRARPGGFFLKPSLIDHAKPGMKVLRRRDLRPGAHRHPRRQLRRGPAAHQRQPVRQRHGHLHPRRWRGPPVRVRRAGGHGRRQRAHPRAGQLLQLRWVEGAACSATSTCTARTASTSSPAPRWSPAAGPTRAPRPSTSASRRTASHAAPVPVGKVERSGAVSMTWTSESCCRPRRRRRGWSIWPSVPRRTGSPTCGPSTATSCGRSRTSSTARSWPRRAT